ncbi:MAG TPA: VOC family protein [Gaiellales bacterium]|nr:VOC family protein [Gaiellales bacterium]
MQTVTPYLLYEDAVAAAAFITEAFGFTEVDRAAGAAGGMHIELAAPAGGTVFLGQPPNGVQNPSRVGTTSQVYVLVDDVQAHHDAAVAVGARVLDELKELPFGHRRYGCADPQGHEWYFAQVIG